MRNSAREESLDRYTTIGAISQKVRLASRRLTVPMAIVLAIEVAYLDFSQKTGAYALAMIGGSTCIALAIWSSRAIGLPLLPMMAVQNLLVYGIPIAAAHENILSYPKEFVTSSGFEVLIFNIAMALSWWIAMHVFEPSRPVSFALQEVDKSGTKGLKQLGFSMLIGSTLFGVLQGLHLLDALYLVIPSGADSILNTLISVAVACGLFLVSMVIGSGGLSPTARFAFGALFTANTLISADGFLLGGAAANVITVAIGLFWGGGKLPWRYLTVSILAISFLNIGKTTMRDRYWGNEDKPAIPVTIEKLPSIYAEWSEASYEAMLENNTQVHATKGSDAAANKNQTLLDRIDNLQNMLFVIDATRSDHVSLLHGATYSLIPPLLVPRVLWPDKPRSHEGQVLLNVHFGRQDLNSTFTTYIAWGLLPEAYGNFGPVAGAIAIGVFLGVFFAWVENFSAPKLIVSMEGFLCLCLLLSLMNSFEMVASVFVTSTFQSMIVIVAASYPFVHRTVTR